MFSDVIRGLSAIGAVLMLLYMSFMCSFTTAWALGGGDGPPNGWYWPLFLGTLLLSLLTTLYVARFVGGKLKAREGYPHS